MSVSSKITPVKTTNAQKSLRHSSLALGVFPQGKDSKSLRYPTLDCVVIQDVEERRHQEDIKNLDKC